MEKYYFKEKTVSVECTRDRYSDRPPKTKNSYRTIPIDDIVVNQLQVYQKWCIETKFAYGMKLDKKKDYVFISYQGGTPMEQILLNIYLNVYINNWRKTIFILSGLHRTGYGILMQRY